MRLQLPPLREELALLPGPPLVDGQPSWTLHDPVRNLFFQIDWPGFEILSRWHLADANAIVDDLNAQTTLQVNTGDMDAMTQFLQNNQLLQPVRGSAAVLADIFKKQRGTWWQWLLHNYLFLRVPLVNPDRWLTRLSPHLSFFYSPFFFRLTVLVALLGVIGVYRDWQHFSSTLVDMLTWQGLLAYGLTLAAVKVLHELGHGFTAKRHGCRVPAMGVAFLVLWPVAYTDTNDAWKLQQRRQRLQIAGAGIATELIIAAWATFAWLILPEGTPRSVAFLLSTTTWVSTLVINASPFMRFDGYFLLSDYLQIPNLHARSFALARWDLRERLFDLQDPVPEHFSPRLHSWLVIFAWVVWIYRLVVFLGIAALVYHFFIKAVGIFLFLVEIGWFVLLPVRSEFKVWRERWPQIKQRRRAWRSLLLALCLGAIFLLPWPTRVHTSGVLQPQNQLMLYGPPHAVLASMPYHHRQAVQAGSLLLQLNSPDIQLRARQAAARQEYLAWQSAAAGFDAQTRRDWQVLNDKLVAANAEQSTVNADSQRYAPLAPYAGVMEYADPDLRPGQWLGEREPIGRLIASGPWQVITYVEESDIQRLAVGDRGLFMADGMAGPNLHLVVSSIDKDASPTLGEAELATLFGGHIAVREKNGMFYPEHAIYRVVLNVVGQQAPLQQHRWRGSVTLVADWEAPGARFVNSALSVFWREAGF